MKAQTYRKPQQTFGEKMSGKLKYVKKNWQLYLIFLLPALLLTIIFKYFPMGGVLIAFEDYNVIDGVFGSPWVGPGILPEIFIFPGLYELSDEYPEVKRIRSFMGIPHTHHPGASVEQDQKKRDTEKDPAFDLRTEFYLCYRTLWYGEDVPFTGWTYQPGAWD